MIQTIPHIPGKRARSIAKRFRGFLPVVVDVETAGFEARTDALLEIAAVIVTVDDDGRLRSGATHAAHVEPFKGANLDPRALEFTGIDPFHPFRFAVPERKALETLFAAVDEAVKAHGCSRAILVGHNPWFDLGFLKAACARCKIKRSPFHAFSTFDTATLGGLAYGQTVLARAVIAAGLEWNSEEAHSAIYDAQRTAELFCTIVNTWDGRMPAAPEVDAEAPAEDDTSIGAEDDAGDDADLGER